MHAAKHMRDDEVPVAYTGHGTYADYREERARLAESDNRLRKALATPAAAGPNAAGIIPFDTRILILPDKVEEKTAGGIILPDQTRDKDKYAQTKATLVAVGGNAFADWGDVVKPELGDRVIVGRYVGNTHKGADGQDYTVCNDEDILALWQGD